MTNGHFTKPIKWKPRKAHRVKWKPQKAHRGKTEIVTDPPVKITRARDGSRGKDVEVELVKKPEEGNWLDENELNDPGTLHGRQSGYGKWTERIAVYLEQIDEAEDASTLPEMLTSEEVVIQDAASRKLKKLEDKNSIALKSNGQVWSWDQDFSVSVQRYASLISEAVIVREAAERKLRKLEDKKEAPKTRFDIIDIPDEEKGDKK